MELLRNGGLSAVHAAARHDDFLREAARDRQLAATRAASRGIGSGTATFGYALRQAVGAQLIRVGERVRGSSPEWAGRPCPSVAVAGR